MARLHGDLENLQREQPNNDEVIEVNMDMGGNGRCKSPANLVPLMKLPITNKH